MATIQQQRYCQLYLRNLPLLEFTSSLYPTTSLADTYIICAQHLVSTTYSLFYMLLQLGLKASNLSVIGKCYSTDPQAFSQIKTLGIDVCESSLKFNSHTSFDKYYRSHIKKFVMERIEKLKSSHCKKIIILDDGGELISEIAPILEKNCKIIGIEQTSSGYHKLSESKLNLPIINVARSPAKLNYETPIITKLILNTLTKSLKDLDLTPGKALIIGNGVIGSHIRTVLKETHEISTFDEVPTKSTIKKSKLKKSLGNFDLIIGCTGRSAFKANDFALLKKNAILVSVSSSDREFDAVNLRKKLPVEYDCHQNLAIDGKWLINCGFPVNFSSNYREIDCDGLQLTRSLILSAVLQAANDTNMKQNGFVSLDLENQRDIIREFLTYSTSKQYKEKPLLMV